MKENNRR